MNILITGATGFIGRALTKRLLEGGSDKVIILARRIDKLEKTIKDRAEVFEVDLAKSDALSGLSARLPDIDTVFHLAANLDFYGPPRLLLPVNLKATIDLFRLAKAKGAKKFIFSSSIEAMGPVTKEDIPADESYPLRPVSSYGQSKLLAEKALLKLSKESGIGLVILRLGNVYGPPRPDFIIPLANALLKRDLFFHLSAAFQGRYIHPLFISDAVEGIMQAMKNDSVQGVYIVAGEEYVTVGKLLELILRELGIETELPSAVSFASKEFLRLRQRFLRILHWADLLGYLYAGRKDYIHRAFSIEKARTLLNFSPKVNLRQGIALTLEWATKERLLP